MARAKRNPNGDGSIEQIKVGKYVYWRFRFTDPETKKRHTSRNYKTQAEAMEAKQQIMTEIGTGMYRKPTSLTVGQWLDQWLSDYCNGITLGTKHDYERYIRIYLKPAFGKCPIKDLSDAAYQRFINGLLETLYPGAQKTLSAKSIKNLHAVMHKAMKQAVKNRIIAVNPCDNADLPRVDKAEIFPLNDDEIKAFLSAVEKESFRDYYRFLLMTGCREAEAIGLQWKHIDFKAGTITIKQQLARKRGETMEAGITETKTHRPRQIRVVPQIMKMLESIRKQQGRINPNGFVFCYEDGSHLIHSSVENQFKRVIASCCCDQHHRLHDLRHTFACQNLKLGTSIKVVSEMLGHANTSTTMNVYLHVDGEDQQEAANRFQGKINDLQWII